MGRMRCSIQSQRGLPCSQCWAQPCAPARVQVHALLVQQVLEPPRGGHHHVDAALEQVQLGAQVYAADAQHGAQLWEPALCQHLGVVVHDLVSLLGQLAAGADDQTLLMGGRGGGGWAVRDNRQRAKRAQYQAAQRRGALVAHLHWGAPPTTGPSPETSGSRISSCSAIISIGALNTSVLPDGRQGWAVASRVGVEMTGMQLEAVKRGVPR